MPVLCALLCCGLLGPLGVVLREWRVTTLGGRAGVLAAGLLPGVLGATALAAVAASASCKSLSSSALPEPGEGSGRGWGWQQQGWHGSSIEMVEWLAYCFVGR